MPNMSTRMGHWNRYEKEQKRFKNLTINLSFWISPQMWDEIAKELELGRFPDKAEFLRHLIRNYFDRCEKCFSGI